MNQKVTGKIGLDILLDSKLADLKGLKLGVVCNQASLDSSYRHIEQVLSQDSGLTVERYFAPEHGIRGELQDMETVEHSSSSGVEVKSLYGRKEQSLYPNPEDLEDLDAVIFDLPDIGARYYTFAQTLAYLMQVAAKTNTKVIVLDRPNPISGAVFEGTAISKPFRSFCGLANTPQRHGLSLGELAQMFNRGFDEGEFGIAGANCELEIIKHNFENRALYLDETDLPWVAPSPNMPTMETAVVYPGACLFEGTSLSEGRGTTLPFEQLGAPWIEPKAWKEKISSLLPSEAFHLRETYFVPKFQKHANQTCKGLHIHIKDRSSFDSVSLGLAMIYAAKTVGGSDFGWRKEPYEFKQEVPAIDLLYGSPVFREIVDSQGDFSEIIDHLKENSEAFGKARREYLLY